MTWVRAVLLLIVIPLWTAVLSVFFLFATLVLKGKFSRKIQDQFILLWAKSSCWFSGVKVVVVGLEKIPSGSCLFLFNHVSFVDIFVMSAVLPSFRFGAKIELFSLPFFGAAMRSAGVLPITRENRQAVLEVYKEAVMRAKMGERFALAPEGTRQTEEGKLGPFKSGPFLFALDAQIPLVPVVIKGAGFVLPKGSFFVNLGAWRSTVCLEIQDPISTEGFSKEARNHLKAQAREAFLKALALFRRGDY